VPVSGHFFKNFFHFFFGFSSPFFHIVNLPEREEKIFPKFFAAEPNLPEMPLKSRLS